MGISKVILNGVTKVDLTQDTVASNNLLSGETATGADGEAVEGAIASKASADLTVSGATVTAPAGFYSAAASKSVATTTHPNPTASINSSTGVVTASHTQTTGYVTGGTTTGTLNLTTQAAKTVTPTESEQTAVAAGRYTTGAVKVGAISSTYVGSDIAQNDSDDLTASGATVSVPAGYYAVAASKAVASGTAGTPSATKGTVSNHSVSVTPSVTNTTGYITGGTKNGTAVSVSASELVSGTKTISASGTTDVTNYASASVTAGSATTPATTITADPSISINSSGKITATVSTSQNVTPTVSAGYVSSGTAGKITVSGSDTLQLSTQASKTVTPTESSQTAVAAGKYTTGAVTVGAIPSTYVGSDIPQNDSSDLTASGATVTVPAGYYDEDASKSIANASLGGSSTSYTYGSENLEITRSYPNFQPGYMASMAPIVSTMALENKDVTPSTIEQVVTPTSSAYAIRKVTVAAMPSGTAGTPTATKGTVSDNSIEVTPSVTNTSGYISGGTLTGTPVTVSASELVSGTKRITTNGTGIDVMNYASVEVDVRALWVNMGTISSLPVTKTFSGVTTDMICARMELGTPSAQTGDWTINTDTADSVTISGAVSGSTTCKLLLVQAESGTAS